MTTSLEKIPGTLSKLTVLIEGLKPYGKNPRRGNTDMIVDSREHPTMKPVALIQALLANSCKPGGLVLDMFGGSGSTLIAADYQQQRARIIELDPTYVDVICTRYQRTTGTLPTRNREAHDFLKESETP